MDRSKPATGDTETGEREEFVWGAAAIGALINRTPRQTNHMLASGLIGPAQKIGQQWVVSKVALDRFFGGNS